MSATNGNGRLRERLDRNFRWLVVVVALLLVGGVAEYTTFTHDQARQNRAAIRQCQRVQRLRDLVNHNTTLEHEAFELTGHVLTQDSLMRRLSRGDRMQRTVDSAKLVADAGALWYEDATHCGEAVAHPDRYSSPKPRPYGITPPPLLRP